MKTPEQVKQFDANFKPDAWKEYTVEELGHWVHLLVKRARMRQPGEKRDKDLRDARNYLAMIEEHITDVLCEGM